MKSLLLGLLLLPTISSAVTIKIAALAPEGTNWSKTIKEMAREVKKKQMEK